MCTIYSIVLSNYCVWSMPRIDSAMLISNFQKELPAICVWPGHTTCRMLSRSSVCCAKQFNNSGRLGWQRERENETRRETDGMAVGDTGRKYSTFCIYNTCLCYMHSRVSGSASIQNAMFHQHKPRGHHTSNINAEQTNADRQEHRHKHKHSSHSRSSTYVVCTYSLYSLHIPVVLTIDPSGRTKRVAYAVLLYSILYT